MAGNKTAASTSVWLIVPATFALLLGFFIAFRSFLIAIPVDTMDPFQEARLDTVTALSACTPAIPDPTCCTPARFFFRGSLVSVRRRSSVVGIALPPSAWPLLWSSRMESPHDCLTSRCSRRGPRGRTENGIRRKAARAAERRR
jgi:hypothetical protein